MRWSAAALVGIAETEQLTHPVTAEPVYRFRVTAVAASRCGARRSRARGGRLGASPASLFDSRCRPTRICRARCRRRGASVLDRGGEGAGDLGPLAGAGWRGRAEPCHRARAGHPQAAADPARPAGGRRARRRRSAISSARRAIGRTRDRLAAWRAGACASSQAPAFAPLFSRDIPRGGVGDGRS